MTLFETITAITQEVIDQQSPNMYGTIIRYDDGAATVRTDEGTFENIKCVNTPELGCACILVPVWGEYTCIPYETKNSGGDLSNYYTKTEINSILSSYVTVNFANSHYAALVHTHGWSEITNKPAKFPPETHSHDDRYYQKSELSGVATSGSYTDLNNVPSSFPPSAHNHDDRYYTETEINSQMTDKQDKLVSGTNIKTVNNNSLLGSGNITIGGGGGGLSIDDIYPVGSIYMTVDATKDPNSMFTGTTWAKLEGRFLLGSGTTSGTSTSYTSGATDGEASHSLTQSEMPRHTHTQNAHHHTFPHYQNNGSTTTYTASWANQKSANANTSDTTATNQYTGGSGTSQSASNGVAHNNMPPYLVVNMWQRTH